MRIIVDHKLRIARSELPDDLLALILEATTIPNAVRENQMKQGIQGWQRLPEKIELWEWDKSSQHLVLPRGFIWQLKAGLAATGIRYEFDDQTYFDSIGSHTPSSIELRPWQEKAIPQIISHGYGGIWKAPAGSGKTVGILEVVAQADTSAIILVNTLDILNQWKERARQFLGDDYPVGVIGGGTFDVSDYLTIATVQTLSRRFEALEEIGFFDQFGLMCLDECHHATADTYNTVVNRFSSKIRVGVSATPDKTGDFALAQAVLGPIIHETTRDEVNTLVKPKVFRIPTGFQFEYRGKHGRRPSNYPQLLTELTGSFERNKLVAQMVILNSYRHHLVVSKRLDHLDLIGALLKDFGYEGPIMSLTGKEPPDERAFTIATAPYHPCVILSTLADEALDIPRLDAIHLAFPQRNTGLIEQQIGRVARIHPDKTDAIVFDYCDSPGPLDAQWQVRRREVYQKYDYEIQTVLPRDIEQWVKEMRES